jgi:hypothetical protein
MAARQEANRILQQVIKVPHETQSSIRPSVFMFAAKSAVCDCL